MTGHEMHQLCHKLWPICRSIAGPGVRDTLKYLQAVLPALEVKGVPSGTPVFDWTVPDEWECRHAWIERDDGVRLCEFEKNNLHVVNGSIAVDASLSLDALRPHLYTLDNTQPTAIPYRTSYYTQDWGFCTSYNDYVVQFVPDATYHAYIDAQHTHGEMNYGELFIPGTVTDEILFLTYICHPSMANNELSGPVVQTALCQYVHERPRYYSYRFVWVPETIGALAYIHARRVAVLRESVRACFNITCVGDDRAFSFMPTQWGNSLADRIGKAALAQMDANYVHHHWLARGSNERQFCAPGVDVPMVSVMRSKYNTFPEYHTSLDDLTFVTATGLQGGLDVHTLIVRLLEDNCVPQSLVVGEPMLSKHGLFDRPDKDLILDFLSYANGTIDCLDIADRIGCDPVVCLELAHVLEKATLVRRDRKEARVS